MKKQQIHQQYMKERRRIQNTISRLKREGYIVDYEIPKIPKRVTEGSIRNLQKQSVEKIREKSIYLDVETGEIISGTSKYKIQRIKRAQSKKAKEQEGYADYLTELQEFSKDFRSEKNTSKQTSIDRDLLYSTDYIINDRIIKEFLDSIADTGNLKAIEIMNDFISDIISERGHENVASAIRRAVAAGFQLDITPYSSGEELQKELGSLMSTILKQMEAASDIIQEMTDLTYDEYWD